MRRVGIYKHISSFLLLVLVSARKRTFNPASMSFRRKKMKPGWERGLHLMGACRRAAFIRMIYAFVKQSLRIMWRKLSHNQLSGEKDRPPSQPRLQQDYTK